MAYLRRLDGELRGLPRARREEILAEIRGHIAEAGPVTETELRDVLDRLGDPEDIAAEARERFGVGLERMGAREIAALILLPVGGLIFPVIGWIVGVALLWGSSAWSRHEKWVGTLVVPGGLGLPLLLLAGGLGGYYCYDDGNGEVCPGAPSDLERTAVVAALVLMTFGAIFSVIYLARRARAGAH